MIPLLFFDASPSPDAISYVADIWERHMIPRECFSWESPPCADMSPLFPIAHSIGVSPCPGADFAVWIVPHGPERTLMFRVRAVDAAGTESDDLADVTLWQEGCSTTQAIGDGGVSVAVRGGQFSCLQGIAP